MKGDVVVVHLQRRDILARNGFLVTFCCLVFIYEEQWFYYLGCRERQHRIRGCFHCQVAVVVSYLADFKAAKGLLSLVTVIIADVE